MLLCRQISLKFVTSHLGDFKAIGPKLFKVVIKWHLLIKAVQDFRLLFCYFTINIEAIMLLKNIRKIIICAILLCASTVQASSDFQSWNNITITGTLNNKIKYWAEGQARIGDNASRLSQSILRPGLGYQVNQQSSIWAGYAWIYTNKPFAQIATDEHRIWQQFLWIKDYQWIKAFLRTRLEQRFIDRVSTTGWRFRQFGRLQLPMHHNPKYFISATEEVFVKLNNTSTNGSNRGFDQNRLFFGIGLYPLKNWLFEIGYQNHIIRNISGPNYRGNYVAMNLIGNL